MVCSGQATTGGPRSRSIRRRIAARRARKTATSRVHHQRQLQGAVESFSLRSIKLRHHRGYLYTVPFNSLGAVQNMSRDWMIDKLTLGLTYEPTSTR